jgi:uncharacterized DUF497 family protein
MEFEWDSAKAAANIEKHGIDFPTASRVFEDPAIIVAPDPRNYGGEIRRRAIGAVDGRVLIVCFTMRGHMCRIISARRANRRERRAYTV